MAKYEDIINIKHFEPKHKRMDRYMRAAQFAPFSALTGFDDIINEKARFVDKKIILAEEEKMQINEILLLLKESVSFKPKIEVCYFIPDEKKEGGKYLTKQVTVKKIDAYEKAIILTDHTKIPFEELYSIKIIENKE